MNFVRSCLVRSPLTEDRRGGGQAPRVTSDSATRLAALCEVRVEGILGEEMIKVAAVAAEGPPPPPPISALRGLHAGRRPPSAPAGTSRRRPPRTAASLLAPTRFLRESRRTLLSKARGRSDPAWIRLGSGAALRGRGGGGGGGGGAGKRGLGGEGSPLELAG
ncbi:unnamed protein product [Lampetra fluviatilis]